MNSAAIKQLQATLAQHPVVAARALLGCTMAVDEHRIQIVETEAYSGAEDLGSHASRGVTPRTRVMFGPPGNSFVYFTYGTHWMFNVVCAAEGTPGAVLIRAGLALTDWEPLRERRPKAKRDRDVLNGPGKICQALGITGEWNAIDLFETQSPIRIEPGTRVEEIWGGTRIGLAKGKGDELPWRFIDAELRYWAS